jgi:hypothetical protein
VPATKWLVVAKNEYRINTSRIRRIRHYFPILVTGLLAVYVGLIVPALVNFFLDDFVALILSQAAVAMVQIILFTIFIYFMIIPITNTLREEQAGPLEIFLAAPIKPSDVLLGKYLGDVPFYAILVTIITGLFAGFLSPLGLDMLQLGIIVSIFVITYLSSFWIGTVIAALLRTKLAKTARGKDVGKALAMIIALPMVALIYGIQFGGIFQALSNPQTSGNVNAILRLLPSSWGSEIIIGFALNPGNIGAVAIETFSGFTGLAIFFGASLLLGAKAANRAYSLEPTTFTSTTAKPDGVFYKTVKQVVGGDSFGTLLVSIFKDYSRRLENLSNLTYMIGLIIMMNIFIIPGATSSPGDNLGTVEMSSMLTQFIVPIIVVMVTGDVTVQGKDNLFIYRKAPSGETRLIKAMLARSWLITIPLVGSTTALATFLAAQPSLISLLILTGLMTLFIVAYAVFSLGLFLLNPAYSNKSMKLGVNIFIAIFFSIGLFAASSLILTKGFTLSDPIGGMFTVQLLQIALSLLLGTIVLMFGKRKLSRIE